MTLPALQLVTGFIDPKTQALQDNVNEALRPVLGLQVLDGVMITGVSLTSAAPNLIAHGLGRAWVGWFLCDTTNGVTVWRSTAVTVPTSILPLIASAATTVNVWVF